MSVTTLAAVATGGALGAVARYASGQALVGLGVSAPAGLVLVNVLGCGLMGALVARFPDASVGARVFWGAGVLGGFTTFSAFAADAAALGSRSGAVYVAASVALSLLAFVLGKWACMSWCPPG